MQIDRNMHNFPLNKTSLEEIEFGGDIFNKYQMESLQFFANLPSLKKLELYQIKLTDRNINFLKESVYTLPI